VHERSDDSSSSDDGDEEFRLDEPRNIPETSFSMVSTSISMTEGDSTLHLDKLSKELDELVRYVRRAVESLGSAADEASSTFGILAFALEDWDL
jgi:gamma-tubulin complex component 5